MQFSAHAWRPEQGKVGEKQGPEKKPGFIVHAQRVLLRRQNVLGGRDGVGHDCFSAERGALRKGKASETAL